MYQGLIVIGRKHWFVRHLKLAMLRRYFSCSMGLFLQKTNIIRDYLEDYVDGRAFWPQDVWKKYAVTGQLGEFALPQFR